MPFSASRIAEDPAVRFLAETAKALFVSFAAFSLVHLCFWGLELLPSFLPVRDGRALAFIRSFHEWSAVIALAISFTLFELFAISDLYSRLRKQG